MIESRYTAAINKKLSSEIYSWKINDNFEGGVPDSFYRRFNSKVGRPLWIEYKLIKSLPKRGTTLIKPNLSALQLKWLEEAYSANEQVLVVIGVENVKIDRGAGSIVLDTPTLWKQGIPCSELPEQLMSYKEVATLIESLLA